MLVRQFYPVHCIIHLKQRPTQLTVTQRISESDRSEADHHCELTTRNPLKSPNLACHYFSVMADAKVSSFPIPDVDALRNTLRGTVSFPGDATYAAQKVSWNREYDDLMPLAIITCMSAWDVSHAIKYLRKHTLDFTVACGRHTLHSMKTGMIMLDLSGLRGITIDAQAQSGVIEVHTRPSLFSLLSIHLGSMICPHVCLHAGRLS